MHKRQATAISPAQNPATPVDLDHILTSVVVLHWDSLTHASAGGRVRIEYHIGPDGSVENLKLWTSTREYWSLICDCSVHPGWSDGPRFSNGYHSRPLARLLQTIMMNPTLFRHGCEPYSNGLLEVGTPTVQDLGDAKLRVDETFQMAS